VVQSALFCPTVLFYCLTPNYFTCQGESGATQWVKCALLEKKSMTAFIISTTISEIIKSTKQTQSEYKKQEETRFNSNISNLLQV
jgi:hypothetical protein